MKYDIYDVLKDLEEVRPVDTSTTGFKIYSRYSNATEELIKKIRTNRYLHIFGLLIIL